MPTLGARFGHVSNRGITTLLVVLSLVPESLGRLLTAGADLFSTRLLVIATLLPAPWSSEMGYLLSWLLMAYLVYAYTPLLFPAEAEPVVRRSGFRALTCLLTLYFGVAIWGQFYPPAILGEGPYTSMFENFYRLLFGILVGMVGGGLAYNGYVRVFQPGRTVFLIETTTSDLAPSFEDASGLDLELGLGLAYVLLTTVPLLAGAVILLLVAFYPLPEVALLLGVVAGPLVSRTDMTLTLPDIVARDTDVRFLDSLSGATRNSKGRGTLLTAVIGALISALVFAFIGWFFVVLVGRGLPNLNSQRFLAFAVTKPVQAFLALGILLGILLAFLGMGAYSLLHWIRQFERIEPYARYWEATWIEDNPSAPTSGVARPPGLLLPAHTPLLVLGALGPLLPLLDGHPIARMAIFLCLLAGSIAVMGWGFWSLRRLSEPQTLRHEDLDITMTLSLQVVVLALMASGMGISVPWLLLAGGILCLLVFTKSDDVYQWAKQHDEYHRAIGSIPVLFVGLILVLISESVLEAPLALQLVIVFLALLNLSSHWMDRLFGSGGDER